MNNEIIDIAGKILGILREESPKRVPKKLVKQQIGKAYANELVEDSISFLLDEFMVDLVIDYPSKESGLYQGRRIWHLTLLTPEESQVLCAPSNQVSPSQNTSSDKGLRLSGGGSS